MSEIHIQFPTVAELTEKRTAILAALGMTLEQARAQWDDCGCCLVDGNYEDLSRLDEIQDIDFLLGETDD